MIPSHTGQSGLSSSTLKEGKDGFIVDFQEAF